MKRLNFSVVLIMCLIIISCQKKDEDSLLINCSRLQTGIIRVNEEIVKSEISKITADLYPVYNDTDNIGHENNIQLLIDRLNDCDMLTAELRCYACIKTLPVQSEIRVTTDSSGQLITRIIDILTPSDNMLKCSGIHKNN